ncbi:MAG: 30S ribosomal protein S11 [Chlamydiia bacterium]|nr:30S ribosomal protein S11 [Chlamydiia bacterium]
MAKQEKKKVRKTVKRGHVAPHGVAHINATFNNTNITITDASGNTICWATTGCVKFSGSRKSTSFAATVAAQDAGKKALALGVKELEIRVKGPGAGRESAIRALHAAGFQITTISDCTPVPHNGCRPRKRRRV